VRRTIRVAMRIRRPLAQTTSWALPSHTHIHTLTLTRANALASCRTRFSGMLPLCTCCGETCQSTPLPHPSRRKRACWSSSFMRLVSRPMHCCDAHSPCPTGFKPAGSIQAGGNAEEAHHGSMHGNGQHATLSQHTHTHTHVDGQCLLHASFRLPSNTR